MLSPAGPLSNYCPTRVGLALLRESATLLPSIGTSPRQHPTEELSLRGGLCL